MAIRSSRQWAFGVAIVASTLAVTSAAQAEDFLSALFGAFGGGQSQAPSTPLPYASEGGSKPSFSSPRAVRPSEPRPHYTAAAGQAFCVRTCDGRYFPITATGNESRAASCNSFCPASETKVVYGSHIDEEATENGKPYSELPNAFRYRNEIVAGCTCNGKDQVGLAPVKIEEDPTLRKGDIVAGANGLMVASRSAEKRGASLNFSPASAQIRAHYEPVRVMASE